MWNLIVGLTALLAMSGCAPAASSTSPSDGPAGRPQAAAGQPDTAPAFANPSSPRSSGRGSTASAGQDSDQVARGKVIFDQTAGGVGCAYCHGSDGKGKAEFASPDIRGKTGRDVIGAMATRTLMSGVKLSDAEVEAVVAYLGVLSR